MKHFDDFESRYNYMTGLISVVDKSHDFKNYEKYLVISTYEEGMLELIFPITNIIRGYVKYLKSPDNGIDKNFPLDDFIKSVELEQDWWRVNYKNFTDELHTEYKVGSKSLSEYVNGYADAFMIKFKKEVFNVI